MMLSVGLMLGPLLGGALTSAWDWPSVLWFRIPIAVTALLLFRGMRASPQTKADDRFDVLSGASLVLGLVTMLLALNRLREISAVWFALLSALAFAAFIFREFTRCSSRSSQSKFSRTEVSPCSISSACLSNLAAFSVWLLVPYFLARMPAYSLAESGAILATAAAGAALAAPIGGQLAGRRTSAQQLAITGAAANAIGLLFLGAWTEQTPTILRIAALVVQGVELGLFQLAYSDIVIATLPLRDRGVAGSLVLLTRTLGTVTAASVVLMVFGLLNTEYGFLEGFQKTFQFAGLLAFATAGSSALFHRPRSAAAHLAQFQAKCMKKNMSLRYTWRKCSFPGRIYVPRDQDIRGGDTFVLHGSEGSGFGIHDNTAAFGLSRFHSTCL